VANAESEGGDRMSKGFPWVRFFPSDWLAGTRGLSPNATALYITAISLMYEEDGPISADVDWLSRYCSMGKKQTAEALATLVNDKKLLITADGKYTNVRAESEIDYRNKASETQSLRSRKKHSKTNGAAEPGEIPGAPADVPTRVRVRDQSQKEESTGVDSPANSANSLFGQIEKIDPAAARTEAKESKAAAAKRLKDEFTRWYQRYPHKVGKGRAIPAFEKARTLASFDDLIDGVERYKRAKPADRRWQNPATWLNGQGWLDEPASTEGPRATSPPRHEARRDDWDDLLDEERQQRHGRPQPDDTIDIEPEPDDRLAGNRR
jgi:uncharacterized protein YdaU (DUF1376 family)